MSKSVKRAYQTSKIFGIDVFSNDIKQLLDFLTIHLKSQKPLLTIVTPNPEQIVYSRRNQSFLDHLNSADLCLPDGIGLVVASKLLAISGKAKKITERISGREVAESLLKYAVENDETVLIIGGREYGLSQNKDVQAIPFRINGHSLNKLFWLEGYASISSPTGDEEQAVVSVLRQLKPGIVFVAFGAPWQEQWLITHRTQLNSAGVHLAMVVGGAFDVLLGKVPAAPAIFRRSGMEWLYRLWVQPWRWRRQLKLLDFIKLTIKSL